MKKLTNEEIIELVRDGCIPITDQTLQDLASRLDHAEKFIMDLMKGDENETRRIK